MKIRPLQDRVVVRRLDELTKTSGGIIIPDTAKEKPSEGIVEAVGPGMVSPEGKVIPMGVKVGDKVLFGKWSGTEVKLEGETYLLIKEPEILGVIEE
ncbi:MAG: co-chaperone GroES [Alphaproteobacteria bacterium]|nr:co-chaperone GroES [Alphaproteobacteria bacterium]